MCKMFRREGNDETKSKAKTQTNFFQKKIIERTKQKKLQNLQKIFHQHCCEVPTAQLGMTASGQDLVHPFINNHRRHAQRVATQVKDQCVFGFCNDLVNAVR